MTSWAALLTWLPATNALHFATGVAIIIFHTISNSVLQLSVEPRVQRRGMTCDSLVFTGLSQALGSFAIGAVANLLGAASP